MIKKSSVKLELIQIIVSVMRQQGKFVFQNRQRIKCAYEQTLFTKLLKEQVHIWRYFEILRNSCSNGFCNTGIDENNKVENVIIINISVIHLMLSMYQGT